MRIAAMTLGLLLLASPGLARSQGAEQPIPNAGGWRLSSVPQSGCFARLQGDQVDSLLAVNREGKMVIGAGRPEWKLPSGEEPVTLRIDGAAPVQLKGSPVGNIIIVLITDDGMTRALRTAQHLSWTLSTGPAVANVTGLGVAFDAIGACTRTLAPPAAP
jgi:hypothetical protein